MTRFDRVVRISHGKVGSTLALVLIVTRFAGVVFSAPPADAEPASGWNSLITAQALHARLGNPRLRIIDVRSADEYAAGHIPGAINVCVLAGYPNVVTVFVVVVLLAVFAGAFSEAGCM